MPNNSDQILRLDGERPQSATINQAGTLDVCCTALYRPELFSQTLASFDRHVFCQWQRVRLILNVDPLGAREDLPAMLALARRYADEMIVRVSAHGDFAVAVSWVWSQTRESHVFHLEDDWLCLRPVKMPSVLSMFGKPDVGAVRLYLKRVPLRRSKRDIGFTLNPCFFRGDWVRALGQRLLPQRDPEKQIRWNQEHIADVAARYRTVMYGWPGYPARVADIGRDWRAQRGLEKTLDAAGHVRWVASN